MSDDTLLTLGTIAAHRDQVRLHMMTISQELDRRGLAHDLSKLKSDELEGFARINRVARENPYGSDEYRASMRSEAAVIRLHYERNSHHPEHHEVESWAEPHCIKAEFLGFLDIIEMVCDWRAAYLSYGSQGSWSDNMLRQQERYADWFSPGQWWLISQVSNWLVPFQAP